jgi:hypothetical protein
MSTRPEVKTIPLTGVMEAVESAVRSGLTPLIVDRSADAKVDTFFSYRSAIMLDGKKLGLDRSLRGVSVPDIMEGARAKLVSAIKLGFPLVVSMQTSITDFMTTFTDEAMADAERGGHQLFFPAMAFRNAGKGLLQQDIMDRLFKNEEKESGGFALCRSEKDFHVILTTQFSPEDFEEYLFGNDYGLVKPPEMYQFIVIEHGAGEPLLS